MRLIDLDELINFIKANGMVYADTLDKFPTVEAAPVSHGCEYCLDDDCPPLDWEYGLDHIFPDYKFCPMCGRLMEGAENA